MTYGTPNFEMRFEHLSNGVPYVVTVIYASEQNNRRVQSLAAGGTELHGPRTLPDGKAEKLIFRVPEEAITNGSLTLSFKLKEGPNAVVSAVELWAPLPSPKAVHLGLSPQLSGVLEGTVSDLHFDGLAQAQVVLKDREVALGILKTGPDGVFRAELAEFVKPGATGVVQVVAQHGGLTATGAVPWSSLYFEEPRFRPIAAKVSGLRQTQMLLDGTWRFNPQAPEHFPATAMASAGWTNLLVPGQWQQQGFDIPQDRTVALGRSFEIPKSWKGQRIFLRFEAVHGGAHYWVNGRALGYSENLMTPVEFDVTDFVNWEKANELAMTMKVATPSEAASYTCGYAFHNLGGIDRSVRLFALPPTHLSRFHYETDLDSAYKDATLGLNFSVANRSAQAATGLSLRIKLKDPAGKSVALATNEMVLASVPSGEKSFSWKLPVAEPEKWSAEKPKLYELTADLYAGKTLLEQIRQSVGFRKVEVRDRQLWVNGARVKLAGANRHEIDPLTGRAATARHAEEDARLLRGANFNYIRTSHYPPTREFLDACDRQGIYLECEAPFCWTRGRGEDEQQLARQFMTPTAAMLEFNRDHPSIIIWSLANESGETPGGSNKLAANFASNAEYCRQMDPSRPKVFNNEWARDGGACDMAVLHYPPIPPDPYPYVTNETRPILIDEYFPPQTFTFADELKINPGLDIVNWSTGQNGTNSWWSQIYESKSVVGGAIWAGIDEEFYFPDGTTRGYGVWGFVDVWRRKKSLWWDSKLIHSPVFIPTRKLGLETGQKVVRVPVQNRHSFTDLKELRCEWSLAGKRGRVTCGVGPGTRGEIEVPVPRGTTNGALLALRFYDASGDLVSAAGVTLGTPPVVRVAQPEAGCPEWTQDDKSIRVQAGKMTLVVEKATGRVTGTTSLKQFPTVFAARREDKNVFNPGGVAYAQFPDEATRVIESVTASRKGEALAIVVRDHYRDFKGEVEMMIDRTGQCTVSFKYDYSGTNFNPCELGLRFVVDGKCDKVSWRRQTEWDVYPEDHIGRPTGVAAARGSKVKFAVAPSWPWQLDETELGSRDFRATKYNIFETELRSTAGGGIRVEAAGDRNARACVMKDGVFFYTLVAPPPEKIKKGETLVGSFVVKFP